jgi:cytochrome d ubiquinol oxidase subunit I
LWLVAACTPLGFVAVEAGWTVTEVGRQPWIIYGVMKTRDALTPMPGLVYTLVASLFIYALLWALTALILTRLIVREEAADPMPQVAHG